jgi:hypothetical protein
MDQVWTWRVALVVASGARLLTAQPAPMIEYTTQVHGLFASRCLVCHSQEKRSGGLSLATYEDVLNGGRSGPAVRPGKSGNSILVQRITGSGATRMPIGGAPLTPAEIGILTTWIDQGARRAANAEAAKAKWEAPLSLEAPKAPVSPWKNWNAGPDRFTAAYLASHGIAEPAVVSDAVFARRAYLDVQGLLPSPVELQAFLQDSAADKRGRLVARLLADDRKYTDHWISYWNDLLRNEEGVNYYSETAGRKSITPWLQDALMTNKSYKDMVTKLLNPTEPTDPDGFLTGINWRGSVSASQTPALQAAQNTAQVFLGVNLKCNSCHDSFISKWKLKDAYSLAAYFSNEEQLKLYRCDVAQEEHAQARFLFPELDRPLASMAAEVRRAAAAAIFTDPRNGRMPRTVVNRVWQRLMGRGIVENVDEMDGEPWSPELLDWLASDFVANGYDLKKLIATIVESRTYQLPSVGRKGEAEKEYTFRGPEIRRLTAEEFADAVASITGEWRAIAARGPAAAVRPGPLSVSGTPSDGASLVKPPPPPPPPPPSMTPVPVPAGAFTRAWRIPGSSLDRALGRPIRDQVYSTRDTTASTLQALELVNGEMLTHWLWRGARRMVGELPPEPTALLAVQANAGRPPIPFDVDISQSEKLYLIVQDSLSTAPDKAVPLWVEPELVGPNGVTPLSSLTPLPGTGLREDPSAMAIAGLRVKLNSVVVYDIKGKGFTRFRSAPGHEAGTLSQGETVLSRFFVFDRQPSMDRLVPPNPETPLPAPAVVKTAAEAVDRVYWHALGRGPSAAERRIAENALRDPKRPGRPSADGLADLLWGVLMTPEFQLIR